MSWRLTTPVGRKRSVYVRISELLFVPRIVEVATDRSIAPTLPLSYTTQFLPAEGTAFFCFYCPDEAALKYLYNYFNCAAEANGLTTVVHLCYTGVLG